jgi:hypothetical protein
MIGENGLYAVAIQLPHVFLPGSSPEENADVLQVLVESLVAINRIYLRSRKAANLPKLYASGVRYRRTEDWLPIPVLLYQGYGDCKSLAAMRIAELRESGRVAKVATRFKPMDADGNTMWHILVQTGVGTFEDPSKECGMPESEVSDLGPMVVCTR